MCNEQQKRMLNYPPALFEFGLPSLEQIFRFNANRGEYGPGDVETHVKERMRLAALREPHVFERTRPKGTVLQVRGVPLPGGGFVTMDLDVTNEKRRQPTEARDPNADPLTQLPNWTLFLDRFEQVMARVRRGQIAAMHFIDLDRFKQVQVQLGNGVSDNLLRGVAQRLRNAVRAADTVIRYGEDEFVVLQSEIERPSCVARFSKRLVGAIRQPFDIQTYRIAIGASIGVALLPRDGSEPQELLNVACSRLKKSRAETDETISVSDSANAVFAV